MSRDLTDQVALITGSAKSIGKGIACEFAERGAIVIVADKDEAEGERTVAQINANGGHAHFVRMDLTRTEDLLHAADVAESQFGRLDALINNASIVEPLKPFLEFDIEEWKSVVDGNLTGAFVLSQAAARLMSKQKSGGALINILAIQTYSPLHRYSAYCASKGGLEALTRSMAVELASYGIRVNGIAVGAVYADSVRRNLAEGLYVHDTDRFENVPPELDAASGTLVGRLGRPSDIAKVCAFLASDEASFITGSIYTVDGGRLLNRKPV